MLLTRQSQNAPHAHMLCEVAETNVDYNYIYILFTSEKFN